LRLLQKGFEVTNRERVYLAQVIVIYMVDGHTRYTNYMCTVAVHFLLEPLAYGPLFNYLFLLRSSLWDAVLVEKVEVINDI
jgi:hypothetical protein